MMEYVGTAFRMHVYEIHAWSDSQVVLNWIRKPSNHWKVFVVNRVQDIQRQVTPEKWHNCPEEETQLTLSLAECLYDSW